MDEKMTSVRPFRVEALHTLALFALAVAQPVFSTIGEAPEFLVAHNATPLVIVAFAVGLALIAPLAIIAVEWLVSRIYRPAGKVLHGLVVLVLLGIIAQQVLDRFLDLDVKLLLGLSLLLAVLASLLYWRSATVSRMVSIAAIGALLLPLNFLFVSPASRLVASGRDDMGSGSSAPQKRTPVVMLILDEFNVTPLFDADGNLDSARFPGFGELAAESWWFRKAVSPYHQTQFAVPAILTGKLPDPEKAVPSHSDHPRNLFTMLGEHYELNVREALTSLCPQTYCSSSDRQFQPHQFLSDLGVVAAHALLPRRSAAALLPPLTQGWRGFKDGATDADEKRQIERDFVQRFNKQISVSRVDLFDRFIEESGAEEGRLDLLHVLLPHSPYEFLPSGNRYFGTTTQLGMKDRSWSDDQQLINHAYLRYMMQLGLVDRKVSELIRSLKRKGVYDQTLLIVTADHGRAFKPGLPVRELAQENGDVLHVPLFVKLPGQTTGEISDETVSTLDIVPTIVEQLAINTDWKFDGVSLFAKEREHLAEINIVARGKPYTFKTAEITSLPLLSWQQATFGSGIPLADTHIIRRHSDLIGRNIESFDVTVPDGREDVRLLGSLRQFADIELSSGTVPSLLHAELTGRGFGEGLSVAVVANGMVADVVPTSRNERGNGQIASLVSDKYFKDGANDVALYLIMMRDEEYPYLVPVSGSEEIYSLNATADTITASTGEVFTIRRDVEHGYVDSLEIRGKSVLMRGWSFNRTNFLPAKSVALFSGERFICGAAVYIERPDLVAGFGKETTRYSGFATQCPLPEDGFDGSELKAFAVDDSGIAAPLRMPSEILTH
ncbi:MULTISPECIES: sulfatase-like hydrolase/transferase [unclassified Aminobacter]|uniref:sulfatase-like hydrolase/transferase n=1 Tax=unclassified Aminobacter TaxID=2644704 RepID=UPI0004664AD1|nr:MULTISPECIES: sulfatase-like hydrolase/transferase [unclassified Aminobacter]TWH31334.1 Arylsulfatase A and related enzymes [Aminobacter sp. J15]